MPGPADGANCRALESRRATRDRGEESDGLGLECRSVTPHRTIPATALLVDIRNFTPTFNGCRDRSETDRFARFLEAFYDTVVEQVSRAYSRSPGEDLYINSMGDGVLAVLTAAEDEPDDLHAVRGFHVAFQLVASLGELFDSGGLWSNIQEEPPYGIGLESGSVVVGPPPAATGTGIRMCLGHCINVAARLESMTKLYRRTPLMVGQHTNEALCRSLLGEDYPALVRRVEDEQSSGGRVEEALDRMRELNRELTLQYVGDLRLRGVDPPRMAFRLSVPWYREHRVRVTASLEERLGLGR